MRAAVRVEALKLRRSRVGVVATAALVLGLLALVAGLTAGVAAGKPANVGKAGPAASRDWSGLVEMANQVTSAGALLGFGVVLAWMVGREFAEGTVAALYGLPVGRGRIALAKLAVYADWVLVVAVTSTAALLVLGLLLGYGAPTGEVAAELGRHLLLGLLTGAAATPVAWLTSLTRSVLAGVGAAVGIVVVAQVGAVVGMGAWLPVAAPALWAVTHGEAAGPPQLLLTGALAALVAALTHRTWTGIQLDR